jgi:hypothetical protein
MADWSKLAGGGSSRRDEPLPLEAIRDLLGIARSLYAARRDHGARKAELDRLALAGRRLAYSLKMAKGNGPNDRSVAWWQAEQAVVDLSASVDALTPAEWLVEAARKRVRGTR